MFALKKLNIVNITLTNHKRQTTRQMTVNLYNFAPPLFKSILFLKQQNVKKNFAKYILTVCYL